MGGEVSGGGANGRRRPRQDDALFARTAKGETMHRVAETCQENTSWNQPPADLTLFGRPQLDCPLEFSGLVATLVAVAQPPVFHSVNRREFLTRGMTVATSCALALRRRAAGAETTGIAGRAFQESMEIFPNPERGFYAQRRSDRMDRLEPLRASYNSIFNVK